MKVAHLASKLREQIHGFSGKLSKGLCKVARRFVEEMLYGIEARGSVRLSEVARTLCESTSMKKRIDRLSRHLDRQGLWDHITARVMQEGAGRIGADSVLVLDPSDLSKKYAEKMEYLAEVRDGSEGTISNGYWTLSVIGAERDKPEITPLYQKLYSQEAPGFKSENTEILAAVDAVRRHTKDRGLWVIDRGGDRRKLLVPFLQRKARFLIRQKGDRHVLYRGRARLVCDVAESCPRPYASTIIKEDKGKETVYTLEYGFRKVQLPGRPEQLYLLVIAGFGETPLMLLTNVPLRKKRSVLWSMVEAYLARWRIEETIRFVKQSYALEDIRVLTYRRLQNMMALVLAAAYFTAVYLGVRAKLEVLARHALRAAKRIFGIPDFRYYALADGIREILARTDRGPRLQNRRSPPDGQLLLFDL